MAERRLLGSEDRLAYTPVRLGGDFGGLEAPALALKGLGVPFVHLYSSESDSAVRDIASPEPWSAASCDQG